VHTLKKDSNAQRISFIFGDGQRNLATARAICYRQVTGTGRDQCSAQLFVFDFALFVVFDDGQRNLATSRSTRIFYLW